MKFRKDDPVHMAGIFFIVIIVAFTLWIVRLAPQIFSGNKASYCFAQKFQPTYIKAGISLPTKISNIYKDPFDNVKESQKEKYNRCFITGSIFFNHKKYQKAAYYFHKAEALNPAEPAPRYYLMLCYSKLEDDPYADNSMTIRMALEVKALGQNTIMAKKAHLILHQYLKNIAKNKPQSSPLNKDNSEIKSVSIESKILYQKINQKDKEIFKNLLDKKLTLKGKISRTNKNIIYPANTKLNLISLNNNKKYNTSTDPKGHFEFPLIPLKQSYILVAHSEEENISWHLRITFDKPGIYTINLNKYNCDKSYIPSLMPDFDSITYNEEITDIAPLPMAPGEE